MHLQRQVVEVPNVPVFSLTGGVFLSSHIDTIQNTLFVSTVVQSLVEQSPRIFRSRGGGLNHILVPEERHQVS